MSRPRLAQEGRSALSAYFDYQRVYTAGNEVKKAGSKGRQA